MCIRDSSYIQANDRQVAALGIKDTVIVETADAVLVSSKNSVQDVKKLRSHSNQKGKR